MKVSEMKNDSCNVLHWDLLWKCWGCVYGDREEKKAVSRLLPQNHHLAEDVGGWRRQSFALVETAVKHMQTNVKFAKSLIQTSYPFSSKEKAARW